MFPKHYCSNLHLEKARYLLIHSGMEISEIALKTGFADRFHFPNAFKSLFYISPVAYLEEEAEPGT